MAFAFVDESLGDEAELLLVLERLPVWVGGRRDEHRVDLVLAGSPALLSPALTGNMNLVEFSLKIILKTFPHVPY